MKKDQLTGSGTLCRQLLVVVVTMLTVSLCLQACKNKAETAEDDSSWMEEGPSMFVSELGDWAQGLKLTPKSRELLDMTLGYAILRDMMREAEDAYIFEYELDLDSLNYESYICAWIQDPAMRQILLECRDRMIQKVNRKSDSISAEPIASVLNRFVLEKYPLSRYSNLTEEQYYERYNTSDICPTPVTSSVSKSAEERETLREQLIHFMVDHADNPDYKTLGAIRYARLCFEDRNQDQQMATYLKEVIFDDAFSIYDYEAFRIWRVIVQENHGLSRMSDIPYWQFNAARFHCLRNIYRHLEKHPEDPFAWNAIFLFSTEQDIHRLGTIGNSVGDEIYALGLFSFSDDDFFDDEITEEEEEAL